MSVKEPYISAIAQVRLMSPKNSSYKVPHNKIKLLVKDAKQMVNGPYYCPKCKKELLNILADKDRKEVFAVCTCGLEHRLTFAPVFQPIDYYNKFIDLHKKNACNSDKKGSYF